MTWCPSLLSLKFPLCKIKPYCTPTRTRTCVGNHGSESAKLQTLLRFCVVHFPQVRPRAHKSEWAKLQLLGDLVSISVKFEMSTLQNQTMLQLCSSARTCDGNHESESAKLQILLRGLETGYCSLQFCSPAGPAGNDKSKLSAEQSREKQSGAQRNRAEQSKAKQNRGERGGAEQSRAKQSRAERRN